MLGDTNYGVRSSELMHFACDRHKPLIVSARLSIACGSCHPQEFVELVWNVKMLVSKD